MAPQTKDFLAHGSSDESDHESGYDSEAAEISKSTKRASPERASKRRRLSPPSESASDIESSENEASQSSNVERSTKRVARDGSVVKSTDSDRLNHASQPSQATKPHRPSTTTTALPLPSIHNGPDLIDDTASLTIKPTPKSQSTKPATRPGVIYLSSLPPYLRPSALRNLLSQRGFSPITRLFLTPASASKSKATTSSKSNARQLYSEGWLEFASHKTAKKCAQTLNASPIGGKKGGYYRDDLWNMRYLRGMAWGELMAGVQGERREVEARRDEERRVIAKEQKGFVEGVERGRRWEGMRRKRRRGEGDGEGGNGDGGAGTAEGGGEKEEPRRLWRQFEVKNKKAASKGGGGSGGKDDMGEEAREVMAKIF